jgi:hypothetical protein
MDTEPVIWGNARMLSQVSVKADHGQATASTDGINGPPAFTTAPIFICVRNNPTDSSRKTASAALPL